MKALWMNVLSLVVFPLWFVVFFCTFGAENLSYNTGITCVLIVVTLFVHEALHALCIKVIAQDVSVRYGVQKKPLSLYVRIEGHMTIPVRLAFLLAPFVILTLLFGTVAWMVPGAAFTMVLLASVNASGSINDMVRSVQILHQNRMAHA